MSGQRVSIFLCESGTGEDDHNDNNTTTTTTTTTTAAATTTTTTNNKHKHTTTTTNYNDKHDNNEGLLAVGPALLPGGVASLANHSIAYSNIVTVTYSIA